jgi:3-deoxy-D-manno-octulosonic-acid transferase
MASVFNTKARQFVKGRKNWKEILSEKVDRNARYVWFHCASLGEFEQGRPVMEEIKNRFPEYKIILTFFSPSGYEIRKNYNLADIVVYLPVDTQKNAQAFVEIVNPEKVFFVKYEFWYYYISELKRKNIPLYIISAIFRENQHFFKNTPWGKWYRKMLFGVEHLFVQNDTSARLLASVGIRNYSVSGDTRFDRVAAIAEGSKNIPVVEKFRANQPLVVAGSTWKPDEELLAAFINRNPEIKFIIAPHEVSAANMNRLIQLLKNPSVLFSNIKEPEAGRYQTLIIDSVGILSSLYRYGSLAYIGGGFGVGIHNILEAATFGLPVVFGPNYKKFKEAVDLKSLGGAFPIADFDELEAVFNSLLHSPSELEKASLMNKKYVAKNVGSTKLIIKKVFNR